MTTKLPTRTVKGYGWRPDLPDIRDYCFAAPTYRVRSHADLRTSPFMPTVWDQKQEGSCTAHAVGACFAFAHAAAHLPPFMPSRNFIYLQERTLEGDIAQDDGAQIRDGMKACATVGVPRETLYPYNAKHFSAKPSASAMKDAALHKASVYRRIDNRTPNQTLAAVAKGFPVAMGFSVYESFESDAVATTGMVPMPAKGEQMIGGHAVTIVGYSKPDQTLIVRNSWGASWGLAGYFMFPFAYAFDVNLSDDFWTVSVAT